MAYEYMIKYGYLDNHGTDGKQEKLSSFSDAVKKLQQSGGLKLTGKVDKETQKLMDTPRCGVIDFVTSGGKFANFETDSKWEKRELTYRIFSYPTRSLGLTTGDVDSETAKAFAMWQDVSDLKFRKQSSGLVDIAIEYEVDDGPGNTLGKAFFPQWGGNVSMDDSELWSTSPTRGTQLLQTLVHELGHSLGLSHSNDSRAIMYGWYSGWKTNLRLRRDDIEGIQSLYGKSKQDSQGTFPPVDYPREKPTKDPQVMFPPVEDPREKPKTNKKLCSSKIDAIINFDDNSYVFTGEDYSMLMDTNVAPGYPKKISGHWGSLPGHIDASVNWWTAGLTYFFKGDQYWKFKGWTPVSGYPKNISNWPGLPPNLDAALQWGRNDDLYFFKGSEYWKYDTTLGALADGWRIFTSHFCISRNTW